MNAKFIEVSPVGRIQLSAAVVLGVSIVIRHSFAAQIVICAQHPTRYFLWAVVIHTIVIWKTSVLT
jgi:hypothetical protein